VNSRRKISKILFSQVHKELAAEASRLDVQVKAPLVLAELLFTANISQEARKHRNFLLRFTHDDLKAQRYLIGGLEQIIALHADKLMDKTAGLFKVFYDLDILEEKAILEWATKVSKKYVSKEVAAQIHAKAEPFVQWLKEAEEEESTDGEDSEVEIEYSDRAPVVLKKETVPLKRNVAADEDDDLNIDDI
jgi:translation initiation factor 5